jgi:hypothetical protein
VARIRTIKPDFFTSLTISELTLPARLTFIGLWTHADDAGRCVDDVRLIRAALWALDDRTFGEVEKDLEELSGASLIRRYMISGKRYLEITGWSEHQKISHPSKSRLPGPNTLTDQAREDSGSAPEGFGNVQVAGPEGSGEERKGKERNREQGKERSNPSRARAREDDSPISTKPVFKTNIAPTHPESSDPETRWAGVRCPEYRHVGRIMDCNDCKREHGDYAWWTKNPFPDEAAR